MNLSFVLWQVWMQLVMYRWMNSEGRSTAWGERVGLVFNLDTPQIHYLKWLGRGYLLKHMYAQEHIRTHTYANMLPGIVD